MEKVKDKNITIKMHEFYCDTCGKFVGSEREDMDGNYGISGYYWRSLSFLNGGEDVLELKMCLCDECAAKKDAEITEALKPFGFVQEPW